jgi:hypothetical protein
MLPHVLGPKHERQQRPRDSEEFRIGASGGDLGRDLRRGRHSQSHKDMNPVSGQVVHVLE